jgi:hypothetical protein
MRPAPLFLFAFFLTACGGEETEPAPISAPAPAPSALADLLATTTFETEGTDDEDPTPPPPPPNSAPIPSAAPQSAPVGSTTDPTGSGGDCDEARRALKAAQDRINSQRQRLVLPVEKAQSEAERMFRSCMNAGKSCTDNGNKFKRLLERKKSATARLGQVLDGFSEKEAELYPLSKAIEAACR